MQVSNQDEQADPGYFADAESGSAALDDATSTWYASAAGHDGTTRNDAARYGRPAGHGLTRDDGTSRGHANDGLATYGHVAGYDATRHDGPTLIGKNLLSL